MSRTPGDLSTGLKWGPLGMLVLWAVVMGLLYALMSQYLRPKPVTITATGDLLIPKARNGHFFVVDSVSGRAVNFIVDTGASLVMVSEAFAQLPGISGGVPGRVVSDVSVTLGPVQVSGLRVGVGLVDANESDGLLGQSFLSRFEGTLSIDQMTLRRH